MTGFRTAAEVIAMTPEEHIAEAAHINAFVQSNINRYSSEVLSVNVQRAHLQLAFAQAKLAQLTYDRATL